MGLSARRGLWPSSEDASSPECLEAVIGAQVEGLLAAQERSSPLKSRDGRKKGLLLGMCTGLGRVLVAGQGGVMAVVGLHGASIHHDLPNLPTIHCNTR